MQTELAKLRGQQTLIQASADKARLSRTKSARNARSTCLWKRGLKT